MILKRAIQDGLWIPWLLEHDFRRSLMGSGFWGLLLGVDLGRLLGAVMKERFFVRRTLRLGFCRASYNALESVRK